ncbi:MAG TPA: DUF4097 family beta strand repeat-containing protein [Phycisphaerales bacterium]|nr:DUF4097 family beta strand repeat-containing protein [Phycisphaerales bacterium]HMP38398.1 DUF4097 family beta strand repeat-containing protein [Phycisphaerales bacterium]
MALMAVASAISLLAACGSLARETRELEVTLPPADRIVLRTVNGGISVEVDPERATGVLSAKLVAGGATGTSARERVDAVTFRTEIEDGKLVIEPLFPDGHRNGDGASMTVVLPAVAWADLQTSNGAIKASAVSGDAAARTSNGRIELSRIGGSASARTSNGSVELSDVAGDADARTSNGRVVVRSVAGAIEVRTSNGPIQVEGAQRRVDLRTSNGSITLELGPAFAGVLELATSNARIEVDSSVEARRTVLRDRSGTLEFGTEEPRSTATTSNGRITVRQRR